MKATKFEARHPILIHQAIVAAAFATYFADPEDIVWRFIQHSPNSRLLEHAIFLLATIFIGAGAALCTRADASRGDSTTGTAKFSTFIFPSRDSRDAGYFGEWIFAVGLASLAPFSGAVLLVAAEGLRLLRLARRDRKDAQSAPVKSPRPVTDESLSPQPQWAVALRLQAAKWGIFVTMIFFSILLIDRLAEIMALASVAAWMILNLPDWIRAKTTP
jgi:hypothetical protein